MDEARPVPLIERWRAARARTREIFSWLAPEAFDARPIPLRHPFRFYEGHLAAFNLWQLAQAGLAAPLDAEFEALFRRGIDPLDDEAARQAGISRWPARERVAEFIAAADARFESALRAGGDAQFFYTGIEHEEMHQETLLYMVRALDHGLKRPPPGAPPAAAGEPGGLRWLAVGAGAVRLGVAPGELPFAWDNEMPAREEFTNDFAIADRKIANREFLEFVEADGYARAALWRPGDFAALAGRRRPLFWSRADGAWFERGLFADLPLRMDRPVYVSHGEALAFLNWRGWRLPGEAEWARAAALHALPPDPARDGFAFAALEPLPARGAGAQWRGNGWEWTATNFSAPPGFVAQRNYPGYSADFFDDRHFVLKGASMATAAPLTRPSFRNWFQDRYPHAWTAIRPARAA